MPCVRSPIFLRVKAVHPRQRRLRCPPPSSLAHPAPKSLASRHWPISANVGSLGSSAPGEPGLTGVGTANAADVDAPPLRARKWVIVRMASPQPDKTSWLIPIFATRHNENTGRIGDSDHI